MTSNGSTLVECPPKNGELLLSEIYKHPPCVPYKRGRCLKIQVRAKPSKRLLHVDRSCAGLSSHCYYCNYKGRVALKPILFTSNFWRAKNWQKFRKFQILAEVALDEHVLPKTSLIDMYVTRSTELTLPRFFPSLRVLDSPLSSNA